MPYSDPNLYTWSDLQDAWLCPRKWAYMRLGWRPASIPSAMLRGQLVHAGIVALYKGGTEDQARRAVVQALKDAGADESEDAIKLAKPAFVTAIRYWRHNSIQSSKAKVEHVEETIVVPIAGDLRVVSVGDEDADDDEDEVVGGTPDAWGNGEIVSLKTSERPNIEYLDTTGQDDLYAYLLQLQGTEIDLIHLDLITPDYIYRHTRPPRVEVGATLFYALQRLPMRKLEDALAEPHYTYHGCNNCPFRAPCQMQDQGGDWEHVMTEQANYVEGWGQ